MHPGEAAAEVDPAIGAGRRVLVIMVVMVVIMIMGVSMRVPMIVAVVMMVMIVRMAVIIAMRVRMVMIVTMAMAVTLPRVDTGISASAHRTHQSTSSSLTRSSSPAVTCN